MARKADELVLTYRELRDTIKEKENDFKEEIAELKDKLKAVADALLALCNEQNADSLRTPNGTVSRRIRTRYWATDWDALWNFIDEHDAPYLLEKRINTAAMKEFLEENPEDVPVGLQTDNEYVVYVRKPTRS